MLVLALAGVTCVLGVLYALMQHDLKRLLAYHTVENIGIIFIGLGLALAFQAYGHGVGRGARLHRGAAPRVQPLLVQEPACSSAPAPCSAPPASATWSISAG